MKKQILLSLLIAVIIFGCNSGSKYSEEAVNAIKNATDLKVEKVELPCSTIEYKLDGNDIKMINAYVQTGNGSDKVFEFYYSDSKLIFSKLVDNWYAMSEEETQGSIDYNYYFDNETMTKCISENKEIKLSEVEYSTKPEEILALSSQLIKSYSTKDTTILCNEVYQ